MAACNVYVKVKAIGMPEAAVKKTALGVLAELGRTDGDISIHFVGLAAMRRLNRTSRGIDRPTDVLTFSALEGERVEKDGEDIGDIFLCVPYIRKQAKDVGVGYREECLRMLIHGILHAVGYDHGAQSEAKKMFALQERFVSQYL